MTSPNELQKPNFKIGLGIIYFVIAMICIVDRLINNLDLRVFDLIGWLAMFTTGTILIIEGFKLKKNNTDYPSSN